MSKSQTSPSGALQVFRYTFTPLRPLPAVALAKADHAFIFTHSKLPGMTFPACFKFYCY